MDGGDIKFSGQRPRFSNNNKGGADGDNGGFSRAQTAPANNGGMNAAAKPFVAKDDAMPMKYVPTQNGTTALGSDCKYS